MLFRHAESYFSQACRSSLDEAAGLSNQRLGESDRHNCCLKPRKTPQRLRLSPTLRKKVADGSSNLLTIRGHTSAAFDVDPRPLRLGYVSSLRMNTHGIAKPDGKATSPRAVSTKP
jgi:hypothetical protein